MLNNGIFLMCHGIISDFRNENVSQIFHTSAHYLLSAICHVARSLSSVFKQNKYIKTIDASKEELIIYLIPPFMWVNGGILSIFNMCTTTRFILNNEKIFTCLVSGQSKYPFFNFTYFKNTLFTNSEYVLRFNQIFKYFKNLKKIYIHVPEYMIPFFLSKLSASNLAILQNIPHIVVNVMNQNHLAMPSDAILNQLKSTFSLVTQTTAFSRDCSQDKADYYDMPIHRFGVESVLKHYQYVPYSHKRKIIVLSPDSCPFLGADGPSMVSKIKGILSRNLPEYQQIIVHDMKYADYLDLIANARYTITFGEGFDGYFSEPLMSGSISFSVYNDMFFPDKSWLECQNVFKSYDEMSESIVNIIRFFDNNPKNYEELNMKLMSKFKSNIVTKKMYENNILRYYCGEYDYLPKEKN